jgi:hypothetical protein
MLFVQWIAKKSNGQPLCRTNVISTLYLAAYILDEFASLAWLKKGTVLLAEFFEFFALFRRKHSGNLDLGVAHDLKTPAGSYDASPRSCLRVSARMAFTFWTFLLVQLQPPVQIRPYPLLNPLRMQQSLLNHPACHLAHVYRPDHYPRHEYQHHHQDCL